MNIEISDIGFVFCNSWRNDKFIYEQWSFKQHILVKVKHIEYIDYLKYHYRNTEDYRYHDELTTSDIIKMFKKEIREFKLKNILD
jgi:hypothetical protein